ncbi:helix-turn-helix domain-containing protein [Granulicoccus phenolivorans]|uniref:helix-turn-helix domain-containing protein n=1 Tax=Granulicoccus phenolivorans TaxID=266854 RepID=UPI00041DB26C|nr:helix-turn-helix domain-containing protein [Granulicoccus phenolivorans]
MDSTRLEIDRTEADVDSSFVTAAAPVLLSVTDMLAGTSTSLALADPSGVVSWRWQSDSSITALLDRSEFELGSHFAEPCAGTNGIGLAIASRRPVRVIGAEHYKQMWDVWACFAAPVADPITGQMAGLVNITCRAESANHFLAVALRSLTDRIGVALRDAAAPRQHRLLEACLRFRASTRRAVVALDRTLLLADDRAASFHLDRAQVWSAIVEAGPYARMVTLPGGLTAELYPVAPRSLSHGVVLVLGPNTGSRTLPDSGGAGSGGARSSGAGSPQSVPTRMPSTPLQQAEADIIRQVLVECGGNKSEAAERLGISRGTLYQRLRRYGIAG